jgi:hypothetical protein
MIFFGPHWNFFVAYLPKYNNLILRLYKTNLLEPLNPAGATRGMPVGQVFLRRISLVVGSAARGVPAGYTAVLPAVEGGGRAPS